MDGMPPPTWNGEGMEKEEEKEEEEEIYIDIYNAMRERE